MSAIDFPNTPTLNQLFSVGDRTWQWTGQTWSTVEQVVVGPTGPASTVQGPTGPTGPAGGPTGPTGPIGATGANSTVQGPTGPTGPASVVAAASTTVPGIIQLATSAETLTGTATSRAVTPIGLEPLRSRLTVTVADFTALAALSTTNKLEGDLAYVSEGAVYMSWSGANWVQTTTARFVSAALRDTAYAKASAVFRVARVRALDASTGIESAWNGTVWVLDYQVYTNPFTAPAGFILDNQTARRVGKHVTYTVTVTKTTSFGNIDQVATMIAELRPPGLVAGYGFDNNNVLPRGSALNFNGSLQVFGASGRAGNDPQVLSGSYLIA